MPNAKHGLLRKKEQRELKAFKTRSQTEEQGRWIWRIGVNKRVRRLKKKEYCKKALSWWWTATGTDRHWHWRTIFEGMVEGKNHTGRLRLRCVKEICSSKRSSSEIRIRKCWRNRESGIIVWNQLTDWIVRREGNYCLTHLKVTCCIWRFSVS